ncbi:tRNA U34 5-methylaminomethyl-2-thiouridine-forming methyltransferase MnmC [Loktanella sp. DSM 29012]|uniref:tRNA (5-methylaminomethyl-2-thiouridine)(34)-methyltransferase MnmD n=1 Tax=Loktanella sp. DSM 29012 TaxID=1881056 RepID=UPI0008BD1A4C|nr:tRNA (5-methylaminomethyl-2-thiouridine)(34)-methyltransferase MnmD [Loktanella sp. DSM 29012]SEQ45439.1 tRNA U34 5-methylaminomethyl-2-thiouridine-forming methyltransferase MnmC [Loktanella sp. DSM 29012]
MTDQPAILSWKDTPHGPVPVSDLFDDPYYSLNGGVDETAHVFLGGNGLPERFRDGFHIAELGFGTGLNFLCALRAFRASGVAGRLIFTSFELHPMTPADRARALAPFDGLPVGTLAAADLSHVAGPDFTLRVIAGDANATLPAWDGMADAWFLDGFSPAKNPALWRPELLQQVADHCRTGGTCATYSAAGHVRASLAAAGFTVTRQPGYGRKRHMTTGIKE